MRNKSKRRDEEDRIGVVYMIYNERDKRMERVVVKCGGSARTSDVLSKERLSCSFIRRSSTARCSRVW